MQQLAHGAFQFGRQVEEHQIYLCNRLHDAEQEVLKRTAELQTSKDQLRLAQRKFQTDLDTRQQQFDQQLQRMKELDIAWGKQQKQR